METQAIVLEALKTRSLGERVRQRLSGGVTAVQIFHRLSTAQQKVLLEGEDNGDMAARQALARIQVALDALVEGGHVRRSRVEMQTQEGRGPRSIQVDVYRRRR
jgi:hypothetical protein